MRRADLEKNRVSRDPHWKAVASGYFLLAEDLNNSSAISKPKVLLRLATKMTFPSELI